MILRVKKFNFGNKAETKDKIVFDSFEILYEINEPIGRPITYKKG